MGNDGLDDSVDPELGDLSVGWAGAVEDGGANLEVWVAGPGCEGPVVEGRVADAPVDEPRPDAEFGGA